MIPVVSSVAAGIFFARGALLDLSKDQDADLCRWRSGDRAWNVSDASKSVAIELYEREAVRLADRFEAIDPAAVYAPVRDLLPGVPADMLEIGAGTGRDAAWFARQGHRIVAVEPAEGLREAGRRLHREEAITWLDDRLPDLPGTVALNKTFDLILLTAVWHHLDGAQRAAALAVLSGLLAPEGRLLLSIRHGSIDPARGLFAGNTDQTIADAHMAGLQLVARRECESVQAENRVAGVTWTWLAFQTGA